MFLLSTVSPAFALPGPGVTTAVRPTHAAVPRFLSGTPQASQAGVDPYVTYQSEPAPMGMTDYGIGPGGPYSYATTAFMGTIDIVSLKTQNATGDPWMGFQLNVVLSFINGGMQHAYWIQDVAAMDTSQNQIWFLDNVWNMSAPNADISGAALSGNGLVDNFGGTGFYYYVPDPGSGNGINLVYPTTVSFLVTTSLNTLRQPVVTFQYDDGSGFVTYDTVTFTKANAVTSLIGFEVNGNNYNPFGTFYDAELVLGGPGGGASTSDVQSDLSLGLYYWNGHNYQAVQNTYNFGGNTGETIGNTDSVFKHRVETGSLVASVLAGPGSPAPLYTQGQTGTFDIQTSAGAGVLYVSNATATSAVPHQYSFTGGRVVVSVYPGKYLLQLYTNGALYDSGTTTLAAGQTLQLQSPLGPIQITIGYSVTGGSLGFVPPTLTYVHGGTQQTATLSTTPTAYSMDPGSQWSVTADYTSGTERWQTTGQTTGAASPLQTVLLTYYHQYRFTFGYTVVGGGTGYSPPLVKYVQFGTDASAQAGTPVWADPNSVFSYPDSLAGSTSAERWQTATASGIVGGAGTVNVSYFHQYGLSMSYATTGLPSGAPTLKGTQFGEAFSVELGIRGGGSVYYLDSGTDWSVPPLLPGSSSQERWVATQGTSGTVSGATSLAILYNHQFLVETNALPGQGGSVTAQSGWTDAGSTLQLGQVANSGWSFGGWTGSGSGAYSGPLNSTSVQVNAPLNESAVFYPGLRIVAGDNGAVTYSFGSQTGTVPAGSVRTIFAPQGTTVSLRATPASFLYSFSGWFPQGQGASGSDTTVSLQAPASVTASFSLYTPLLAGIAAAVVVVLVAVVATLRRRSRSGS